MSHFKTGRGRCPVNGSKRWSYLGSESHPDFIISYGSPTHEPVAGWVSAGESETGGQMFACEKSADYHDHPKSDLISVSPRQRDTMLPLEPEAIDPQIKHQIYIEMLSRCSLNSSHRSHLVRRQLPYQELRRLLTFGSLPHPTKRPKLAKQICEALDISVEEILRVPGFFINGKGNLSIAGAAGLMIPAFDPKGRIQAFQIRKDQITEGQSRYTWMSSGNKGGVGSGAPACFLGDRHAETLWITEGAIKGGALITKEWATSVLTLAGVGNIQGALDVVDSLDQLKQINIAFDGDWRTKPGVLKGLAKLLEALSLRNIPAQALSWDPSWGKGIDDALVKGLQPQDLYVLPTEGILRAATKVKYANPRLKSEKLLPVWKPSLTTVPTTEELRKETSQVVFDSLRKPAGTFCSVAANTGSGKTYAVIHYSPEQTVQMYRNYGALEEAEQEIRQLHSQGTVRVLYGRIAPPENPNDIGAHKRYERAGCPHHSEMKKRAERGHSPCQGCPLAPQAGKHHESDDQNICAYWRQRFKTIREKPDYLLAVPQSIAANPDLLQLLPQEETCELFGEYSRLVIDDCPEFIQYLTRESYVSLSDVKQWHEHPGLKEKSNENRLLLSWLKELLEWFQSGNQSQKKQKSLREYSTKVTSLKEITCEEPTGSENEILPLKAVRSLASWLAKGGAIRLEQAKEGKEKQQLFYLRPAKKLLERLSLMTVCHLDATPDESMLAWFANLANMSFEAKEMKRRLPRIIQIPDVLWDREQVKNHKDLIRALTEQIHDQGGIVLGFKNREGEEEDHLALDGHWGYSERGFNCFSGVSSIALIGHFSLPTSEISRQAWQMRELSKVMDKALPDDFIRKNFTKERTYSDPWRPFVREMHVCEDPLVEHMRRQRHTSAVVQGSNRPRNFEAPVFLLSGEPLDGLPWEIPVEIWTREELAQYLGMEKETSNSKPKVLNAVLELKNEHRKAKAKQRLSAFMPSARNYANELGRLPGIRELRRFLAFGEGMVRQELAYLVRDQLALEMASEKDDQPIQQSLGGEGNEALTKGIEWGVPHTPLNTINSLTPQSGTPPSIPKNDEEDFEPKEKYQLVGQNQAPIRGSASSFGSRPLKTEELAQIPPLARVRLGLCDFGAHNGWNDELIRQVARGYNLDKQLLYRFIGVAPKEEILLE